MSVKLASNFLLCMAAKISVRAFGFITFPLLTFYITQEQMGRYQLLSSLLAIFVECSCLGTRQYFEVEYFKMHSVKEKLKLLGTNFWIYTRLSLLLFIPFYLAVCLEMGKDFKWVAFFVIAQGFLKIFNEIFFVFLRNDGKFVGLNLIWVTSCMLQMLAVVSGFVFFKMSLLGFALILASFECFLLFLFCLLYKRNVLLVLKVKSSLKESWPVIKKAVHFIPSTLSFWLLISIDQWMLATYLGVESVGAYAVAAKFAIAFDFVFNTSFLFAYTPFILPKIKNSFQKGLLVNALFTFLTIGTGAIAWIATNQLDWTFKWVIASPYWGSIPLIAPLIFIGFLRLANQMSTLALQFMNKTTVLTFFNLATCAINVYLNSLWIPRFGIEGALLATASSFGLIWLVFMSLHAIAYRAGKKTSTASLF